MVLPQRRKLGQLGHGAHGIPSNGDSVDDLGVRVSIRVAVRSFFSSLREFFPDLRLFH